MKIEIEVTVAAPLSTVWNAWVHPDDIQQWNVATKGWCCPSAEIDFTVGGEFSYRMEEENGSMGFDFKGTFTHIENEKLIKFTLDDGREVAVEFTDQNGGVTVKETFEAENQNPPELQRQGWLSILERFKAHVE